MNNVICDICGHNQFIMHDNFYKYFSCYGTLDSKFKCRKNQHCFKTETFERFYFYNSMLMFNFIINDNYTKIYKINEDEGHLYFKFLFKIPGKYININKIQKVISFL